MAIKAVAPTQAPSALPIPLETYAVAELEMHVRRAAEHARSEPEGLPWFGADYLNRCAPDGPPGFMSGVDLRVWPLDSDWYAVEAEASEPLRPTCVSVLVDIEGVLHCSCPAGVRRIGCDHILAVGEHIPDPFEVADDD